MKILTLLSCIICASIWIIMYSWFNQTQPEEPKTPFKIKLDKEQLLKSMRKISFENNMDHEVSFLLKFQMSDEDSGDEHEHILGAHDAGWIPYFVPGILEVYANNSSTRIDITEEQKEYKVIVTSDGTLSTEKREWEKE